MKKFFNEFKSFALKGNIFNLAVGVVIGGAFNKIVSSLVTDIIMPIIGFLTGGINFAEYRITLVEATKNTSAITLNIGLFIQNVADFLIISLSIFLAIKLVTKIENKINIRKEVEEKTIPQNIQLLSEIRDLLKESTK
ncbi:MULTISPECIES: large-conductance mechanosensitive channel protein MscL [unclassified Clostridium]|uniref:large-conductance mechanosensitive channel protein MscL n=1 Tax=Clostridium TaxID=1485 RepID=UPI001C8CBA2F|nr:MULTISPECIES: large-conductance mechanosensitive channel protein MscL [unclassified Clostridium]MBX9137177.1 large-conductance mechanosensitive channel protein MscL [Clostridium sp. K12(2020)]MBX9143972.1 large-conductance mechanosensitive channel protein MscL [Clostridium sp. K13]MDU2289057.1 large-conductance mechanosensitive channel protein MscL [Clostridium celatum]MDU4326639.1 large-conductance mechanosensitive channel protein MscL [Clostridium celatum]